jgi:peptidoglycan/LPS O-acetylase OafA/YrhL
MPTEGFGTALLMWLGDVSFGIYLWHFPVMRTMALLMPEFWSTPTMSLVALAVALPITFTLASLSYYLLERPLMGWGKKIAA